MSHRDFSILGVVSPTRRLSNVSQGGVPPQVHVKQAQQQRAISARKEEAPVHNAVQVGRLRVINAGREVRLRVTNVGVVVVQDHSVRLGLV